MIHSRKLIEQIDKTIRTWEGAEKVDPSWLRGFLYGLATARTLVRVMENDMRKKLFDNKFYYEDCVRLLRARFKGTVKLSL